MAFFDHVIAGAALSVVLLGSCKSTSERSTNLQEAIVTPPTLAADEEQRCVCVGEWYCQEKPEINGTSEAKDISSEAGCLQALLNDAKTSETSCDKYIIAEESFSSDCVVVKTAATRKD